MTVLVIWDVLCTVGSRKHHQYTTLRGDAEEYSLGITGRYTPTLNVLTYSTTAISIDKLSPNQNEHTMRARKPASSSC
jgi:hypothetical protein